jgi:hypothetical protein
MSYVSPPYHHLFFICLELVNSMGLYYLVAISIGKNNKPKPCPNGFLFEDNISPLLISTWYTHISLIFLLKGQGCLYLVIY